MAESTNLGGFLVTWKVIGVAMANFRLSLLASPTTSLTLVLWQLLDHPGQ